MPGASVPASWPRLLRAFMKSPSAHTSPPSPSRLSHTVSLLPGARPPRSFLIHPHHPGVSPRFCLVPKRRLCPGPHPDAAAPTSHSSFNISFSPPRFSQAFWVPRVCSRGLGSHSPPHYCLLLHAKQAFHREIVHRNVSKPQCEVQATYKQMHLEGCLNCELYTQKRLQTI